MIGCPAYLQASYRAFIAEEVAATWRHDLKNGLGAIGSAAFYIRRVLDKGRETTTDPKVPKFLEIIADRCRRATDLVDRSFVPKPPAAAAVGVAAAATELIAAMVPAPRVPIALAAPAGGGSPPAALAARPELDLALFCLIENAVEAVEAKGAGAVSIEVAAADGNRVAIRVHDDGQGIAAELRERARERFFTTRGDWRLGLGLPIVVRIADRAGGSLELAGRAGGGTTATLALPAAERPASDAARAPAVLLVEDDEATRLTMAALLEESGWRVVEATSLAEARTRLEAPEPYSLAILDLRLGDGRGTDLIPLIRAQLPRAKVAVLSGSAGPEAAAADLVLLKGTEPSALLDQLARLAR